MADTTHISWADATWSPWTGCTKISPACDGCYAAHLMDTRMHRVEWGSPGEGEGTRSLMSDSYWSKPLAWNRQAEKTGVRPWVFPSLCDPFDTAVPPPWRRRFVDLMEATPNIVWLLLTKRIGNVSKLTDPARGERPLPRNVALLASVVTQAEYDRDMPKLAQAARVVDPLFTGLSMEPLLGRVNLHSRACRDLGCADECPVCRGGLDWVIAGGESDQGAHQARPADPTWIRSLRDQASAGGIAFHFKQWGTCGPDLMRGGIKANGRLLDGVAYDARPALHL